jgi:hypothetical protein
MPKSNYCNYEEAYKEYVETRNISEVASKYKKRRSVLKREFIQRGFEYPIERLYSTGYNLNHPPKKEKELVVNFFEEIDTVEKAYFLGLVYADGSVGVVKDSDRGNRYSFRITLQEQDKYILERFRESIGIQRPLSIINPQNKDFPNNRSYRVQRAYQLDVNRRDFVLNLVKHGVVPNKTYEELSIPTMNKDLIPHFIRGYFDGDGCVGIYPEKNHYTSHCYFVSKTKSLLAEIKDFLKEYDIESEIKEKDLYHLVLKTRNGNLVKFWDLIKPKNNEITMTRKAEKFAFYSRLLEKSKKEKSGELLGSLEIDNQQPSDSGMS